MNIELYRPIDSIDNELIGIVGCRLIADRFDEELAKKLYLHLTSSAGVEMIKYLRKSRNLIVLCEIPDKSKKYDHIRIIISGLGLNMQFKQGRKTYYQEVSCLFTAHTIRVQRSGRR